MVNCINDEDVKLVLYADDTNIFIVGNEKNNHIKFLGVTIDNQLS